MLRDEVFVFECVGNETMKHQASRELFAYWNGLRGARTAPERSDIDPAAIRTILADTFMLDVGARFPLRLAGTRVNALFDAEKKGCSFLDLWRAEERHNVAAVMLAVADGANPVVAGAAAAPRGYGECTFELLFLPLRHFGKTHARILGIVTATTQPSWLGLMPIQPLGLRSLRIIDAREDSGHQPVPFQPIGVQSCVTRPGRALAAGACRLFGVPLVPQVGGAGEAAEIGRLAQGRPSLRLIEGGRQSS